MEKPRDDRFESRSKGHLRIGRRGGRWCLRNNDGPGPDSRSSDDRDSYASSDQGSARRYAEELEKAAARSKEVGDEQMSDDIRWIRSYVLQEGGGSVGTVCIYQASSPEAIRDHASRADLPIDQIIPVADTVVVRPDHQC